MSILLGIAGCGHRQASTHELHATAAGAVLVESSGGKQVGPVGTALSDPLVVQVNDEQGTAVAGVIVKFRGPAGVSFNPSEGLTDASGQLSTSVTLGSSAGRYSLMAFSSDKSGKEISLRVSEIALDYEQRLGRQIDERYCARCHNPESTIERVSNYDNLAVKPHSFTEGETLNKMSDADLIAIISHGGPGLNRSALMPPYASTLGKAEIQALIAYIRLVSDPPYRPSGVEYAKQ
jgi:mono/diheme cytochrome c family protein